MSYIDTNLFIRPLEPLFFGAPKPFNAGEFHHAGSQFPPSPMTMQGIVRSQLLRAATAPLDLDDWSAAACKDRAALVGPSNSLLAGWQLKGPLPATVENDKEGERYLHPWAPAPRFLYRDSGRQGIIAGELLSSPQPACNDLAPDPDGKDTEPLLFGPPAEQQHASPLGGWVDGETLHWALSGQDQPLAEPKVSRLPPFVKDDQRQPGIALDRRRNTAQDGMLYLLEHLRFQPDSGFWGSFSGTLHERLGPEPFSQGVGAAGRKARLVSIEEPPPLTNHWRELFSGRHLPRQPDARALFWLYLLTPVRLEKGKAPNRPLGGVRLRQEELPPGVVIHCRAALTGAPLTLGGMDTAQGRSRPNHAYLPAGSAWLFEIETTDQTLRGETLQRLNNTHPLGDPEEARFGFGQTLVGIGPHRQGEAS